MKRITGAVCAVVIAAGLHATNALSICAIYTPDDVQYWFFLCYLAS